MKHRPQWALSIAVALCCCAAACGGEGGSSEGRWSCNTSGTRVGCKTAVSNSKNEQMAYVCKAGQKGSACPDAVSVKRTPGLEALLASSGAEASFASLPWACLVTGGNEIKCLRDVAGPTRSTTTPAEISTPAETAGSGGAREGTNGGGTPASPAKPSAPTTCEPTAWEPYFAAVATFEYQTHGVRIAFPVDLFDVNADFNQLAVASASDKSTPGAPSCAAGEQGMREQSWLDATLQGCDDLSQPILVMCQQGANYAPDSGACNATATW